MAFSYDLLADEKKLLGEIAEGPRNFLTQGGRVGIDPDSNHFLFSSIAFDIGKVVHISSKSYDIEFKLEVFCLSVFTNEPDNRTRPPFKPVVNVPNGFDLESLNKERFTIALVYNESAENVEFLQKEVEIITCAGVLLTYAKSERRFLISSTNMPFQLMGTHDDKFIKQYINSSHHVELLF